ncbi:MAG TPA: lasso peptide biosynthesis B2 protein [Novosphingobium sp.]|nr:lasso peptide biosynthesis B2 protein [Novosphingobium sp.]
MDARASARASCLLRPSMSFRLPSGVHHCMVESRSIFLDLARDRYFALPADLEAAFRQAVESPCDSTISPDEVERLIRAGVLEAADEGQMPAHPVPIVAPTADRVSVAYRSKASLMLMVQVVLAQLMASLMVRIVPMGVIARHLERLNSGEGHDDDVMAADRLAAAFRRASVLIRVEGNCLPRTLAFVWLARRRRCNANLVIGVRINPFSAHCWAQAGDVVLNDRLDRANLFKPILHI